jgi:hypothetical protein
MQFFHDTRIHARSHPRRADALGGRRSLDPAVVVVNRRMYPIYDKCVELDIAAGVPEPRVRMAPQFGKA